MPLLHKISVEDYKLALWRIEEPLAFFEPHFPPVTDIRHENRKLQWYATRFLANELAGSRIEIVKNEFGKPLSHDGAWQVSLSHTTSFAGVMMSPQRAVGIDLEALNPKVERIAHKFLQPDEIEAIAPADKLEKLMVYWSAKEALYKLYGQKQLEFKSQLLIAPFELAPQGTLAAVIKTNDRNELALVVHYEFFENHVLAYVVGR